MIDVSFIEIGTSDFNTCLERASDDDIGFSIEPIQEYLDRLPNRKNVTKVCAAISTDGEDGICDIYYIPPKVIEENNMRYHWKGCNSLHNIHPEAGRYKNLYEKHSVPKISLRTFLETNKIGRIELLQIDVEGWDCHIMDQLANYLDTANGDFYPRTICFEHKHSKPDHVQRVLNKFADLGYMFTGKVGSDSILKYR